MDWTPNPMDWIDFANSEFTGFIRVESPESALIVST